jgi:hypothetical protein
MKYLFFLFSIPLLSSCATMEPEVLEAIIQGAGKLFGFGAKVASRIIEDKSPGAAKAFDTLSDIAYGATGQNYEDHMRQHYNLKEGDPLPKHLRTFEYSWDDFPITFINGTNTPIFISGPGITKGMELSPGRISYDGTIEPRELILENRNPYRETRDYELIYDKNTIDIEEMTDDDGYKRTIIFTLKENEEDYFDDDDDHYEDYFYVENKNENNFEIENNLIADNNNNQVLPGINEKNSGKSTDVLIDDYSFIEPTEKNNIVQQETRTSLPLINNFQVGMYYVQIGSYANVNAAYSEIAKIDNSLPVAVMRTTVRINGVNKEVHRILIGPLDYRRSHLLLRQFRVNYRDAFVWQGR